MKNKIRIILASASPRRRELLTQIVIEFEVVVSDTEENVSFTQPARVVEELSVRKAGAVLEALGETEEDVLVIGADTMVALEGEILGKPRSLSDAGEMLGRLSGKTHGVYTGVTVLYRPGNVLKGDDHTEHAAASGTVQRLIQRKTFHERTDVTFYPLTAEEIAFYLASGDCMDKAGAYGIQGIFARYVERIEGDYNNVVGLPAGRLYQEAKEWLT